MELSHKRIKVMKYIYLTKALRKVFIKKKEKKLGIIGGMGPASTVEFYDRIIKETDAHSDNEHIDMIIINHASIIDRTTAISTGRKSELINSLVKDAITLEKIGVSVIAIPCNTAHSVINEVQKKVNVPIINMIEETTKNININEVVGVIATKGTIKSGLYQKSLENKKIKYIVLDACQSLINEIIYIDAKEKNIYDTEKMKKIIEEYKKNGASKILLGCTELSKFSKYFDEVIDPMDFLVDKSITSVGKNKKFIKRKNRV